MNWCKIPNVLPINIFYELKLIRKLFVQIYHTMDLNLSKNINKLSRNILKKWANYWSNSFNDTKIIKKTSN